MLYFLSIIFAGCSVYMLTLSFLAYRERHWHGLEKLIEAHKRKKINFSIDKAIRPLFPFLKPIYNIPYLKRLQFQLEVLKLNNDIGWLILLKLMSAVVSGILVLRFSNPLYVPAGIAAGFFIPDMLLIQKIKKKKEDIVRSVPETIDLLDLCIGAGLDFTSSVRWIIDKTESNAFVEQLQIVLGEIHVGKSQSQALRDMAKRLNITDVNSFVRSVVQAENMGTSLEEAFTNLSEDTRLSRFQAGERYAIKASLKILFPLLFFILPVIMIVVAGPIIVKFMQGGLIPSGGIP